jgi:transposase InsO family protein
MPRTSQRYPAYRIYPHLLRQPVESAQFTSQEFTGLMQAHNIQISMDGTGRWRDNVFVERLWRILKYEVYLHAHHENGGTLFF